MAAYLLTFNPTSGAWDSFDDDFQSYERYGKLVIGWSSQSNKIRKGGQVFMLKQGEGNRGIVASGYVITTPKKGKHWNNRIRPSWYFDLLFDRLVDWRKDALPRASLSNGALARVHWNTQSSGVLIPEAGARSLSRIWQEYLRWLKKRDGFVVGKHYKRNYISKQLGGGIQSYAPNDKGFVRALCLTPENNPEFPPKVHVSTSMPQVQRAGMMMSNQGGPLPVFTKQGVDCWKFLGLFRVTRATFNRRRQVESISLEPTSADSSRQIVQMGISLAPQSEEQWTQTLKKKEEQARKLSIKELKSRAARAPMYPVGRSVLSIRMQRNQSVSQLVKRNAKGVCQLCKSRAPFKDNDGQPFLETHHIVWLKDGGDDSIENTAALCPNCHRKMHALDLEQDRRRSSVIKSTEN